VGAFVEHVESVPTLHVVNLQQNDKITPDRIRILDMLLKHRVTSEQNAAAAAEQKAESALRTSQSEFRVQDDSNNPMFPSEEVNLWDADNDNQGYFDFGDEVELAAEEAILVSTGRELLSLALGQTEESMYDDEDADMKAYHGDGEILELPMPYTRQLTQQWDMALAWGAFGSQHVVQGSDGGITDEEDAMMISQAHCKLYVKRVVLSPATGPMQDLRKGVLDEIVTHMNGHPNMAPLLAMSKTDEAHQQECAFVYQTASHGRTLHEILTNRQYRGMLSWPIRLRIARQIAHALEFLHNPSTSSVRIKSFYGDLQPNNIIVSMDTPDSNTVEVMVQLLDAGLSRLIGTDRERFQKGDTVFGSRAYRCPRYERGSCNYDQASDMFAFGIILAELWTSKVQKSSPLQPLPQPGATNNNSNNNANNNTNSQKPASTPSPNKKKKNRKKKGKGGNSNNNQNARNNNTAPKTNTNTMAYDVYYDHLLVQRPLNPDPLAGPLMRPELPQVFGKLIQYCTNVNPKLRPTAAQVGHALDNLLKIVG